MITRHVESYSCTVTTKEGIPEVYGLKIRGAKVIDLKIKCYTGDCCCSMSNDRNKYDKKSRTIICKKYNSCLAGVWVHLQEGQKADIKEVVKMALGEY